MSTWSGVLQYYRTPRTATDEVYLSYQRLQLCFTNMVVRKKTFVASKSFANDVVQWTAFVGITGFGQNVFRLLCKRNNSNEAKEKSSSFL